jgi:hypothetical protein
MYFRWAARLSIGLLIAGVTLGIALAATYSDANAGLPVLFFGAIYVVLSVPICFASAVLAGLSLSKGEDHRKAAIAILIVMGWITWMFKAAPFQFTKSLIEGYLQRPWP